MELTIFDWAVIGIIGLSALLALFRGFIREVLSLGTWIAAAIITTNFYDEVAVMLQPHFSSKTLAAGAATFGTFITVLIVLSIFSAIIIRFLQAGSDISILDSLLGMMFGVARGVFIISLAYLMITTILPADDLPDWLGKAKTRPIAEFGKSTLVSMAPDYVKKMEDVSKEAKKEGENRAKQEIIDQLKKEQEAGNLKPGSLDQKRLQELLNQLEQEKVAPQPVDPAKPQPAPIAP